MMTKSMIVDVSQDWALACHLQERFLEVPQGKTRRLMFSARCRQMRALGGGCFSFLALPGDRVAFAAPDASGNGLPAALLIANVQSTLRTAALFAPEDMAAVVTAVNRQLYACSRPIDTPLYYMASSTKIRGHCAM
jgi:sigma-B regulation protein RsbU (phosphoserine phosphatase)